MRTKILIFSHNTHSFLNNEIMYASRVFKEVYLIMPYNQEIEEIVDKSSNIKAYFYSKKELKKHLLYSFYKMFEINLYNEIIQTVKNNNLNIKYLKYLGQYLALNHLLNDFVNKYISVNEGNAEDWVFYSAWYASTAFSISNIKSKYPNIKTVSLAHSFEVDKLKSDFTVNLFRKEYHRNLDLVSFISEKVFRQYINELAKVLSLDLSNTEVRYLGTRKILDGFNPQNEENVIKILSCSHIVPIKRIELIFEALDSLKGTKIIWDHIGTGSEMEKLQNKINNKTNKNLEINLLGKLDNKEVHELYTTESYDMFINVSKSEGIPVSIMEAISYGIPIIATDVGGNSEIVNKEFGILLSKNPNVDEINKAILSIKEKITLRPFEISNKAYQYFENSFNADKIRINFFEDLTK